jgi:predicted transcriptional regulator
MSDDICENYHGGNPESYEANEATAKERDRSKIYLALLEAAEKGQTCDELEICLAMAHQTASARCSELLREGVVVRARDGKGERLRRLTRQGCWASVLILARFAPASSWYFNGSAQGELF